MNVADELNAWYRLRDRLRSRSGRDAEERLPSLPHHQHLLDHVEEVIARMEHLKRAALRDPSAPDTLQPTEPPTVTPREETR